MIIVLTSVAEPGARFADDFCADKVGQDIPLGFGGTRVKSVLTRVEIVEDGAAVNLTFETSDDLDETIIELLASEPTVQRFLTDQLTVDLCRACDCFVGYGGAGVFKPPAARRGDMGWLGSHCWGCGRSREQVNADPWGRVR